MSNTDEGRILVVDDDPLVRSMLRAALTHYGHEADLVGSAEKALEIFDPSVHRVCLLDIKLPGIDGFELAERLIERGARGIVFISGYVGEELAARLERIPHAGMLAKPFELSELERVLQEAWAAPKPPPA